MTYVKRLSETAIDANPPHSAVIDGKVIVGTLPEAYLNSIGYYRYSTSTAPTPYDGYHVEARYNYDNDENPTQIIQSWVQVKDPDEVAVYSKVKILLAAQEAGFIEQLIEFIKSNTIIECIWNASNTIEDNELLDKYINAVAEALGKTEQQVRDFLDEYCLAD